MRRVNGNKFSRLSLILPTLRLFIPQCRLRKCVPSNLCIRASPDGRKIADGDREVIKKPANWNVS